MPNLIDRTALADAVRRLDLPSAHAYGADGLNALAAFIRLIDNAPAAAPESPTVEEPRLPEQEWEAIVAALCEASIGHYRGWDFAGLGEAAHMGVDHLEDAQRLYDAGLRALRVPRGGGS